ncbi:MAG TPA: response regulator transcription factor [Myxococcota bacterium]|nr:response regulator transcription factor [Myxococcota bacterium]
MLVLYVEDDPIAREFIQRGVEKAGIAVEVAADVARGTALASSRVYDVLILDVMLGDGDGFALLQDLRLSGIQTPALFLSARTAVADRVRGLEAGADDYLPKPFALAELVARVHALARRRWEVPAGGRVRVADLELDVAARRVTRARRAIDLSPRQFALLEYLLRNCGHAVSRSMLTENVWGHGFESRSNAIDVQINYLRQKVDRDFEPKLIHTLKGFGYILEDRSAGADPPRRA